MQKVFIPLILVAAIFFYGCPGNHMSQGVIRDTGMGTCDGLPALRFQNESDTIDGNKVANLATDLSAAAKADATKSVTAPASGSGSVDLKGAIGKTINEHLTQSSQVTEDFWQEDIVFRQCLCFLDAQSKRKDIPEADLAKIRQASLDLLTARSQYALQFEKKNGKSPK